MPLGGTTEYVLRAKVESDGVSQLAQSMQTAERSVNSLKAGVGAAGGALAALSAGALAGATKAAADFESNMVELEKVTSSTFASDFRSNIIQLSKDLPATANEVANLAAEAGRFGVAEKNIESFTRTAVKMSEATDMSVDQVGESFAKLSTLTDTPITKMENLGSSINKLSNISATSSSEIVSNMMNSASSLNALGASQTEIAALSATLNETYQSASKAGRGLRRIAQEMMDPKKANELATELGMTNEEFRRMRDNSPVEVIKRMATTMKEGGVNAEGLRSTLTSFSRQALTNLSTNMDTLNQNLDASKTAFKENASLQREFEAAMDTAKKQAKQLKSSILAVAIQTGDVFLPYVTDAIRALRGLVDRFADLNSATNGMAGVIAGLVGVVGGLATAFVGLYPAISAATPALTAMAGATSAVLAPAAALTSAVLGLAAAFKTNFAGIRTMVEAVLLYTRQQAAATATTFREVFGPAVAAAGDAFDRFKARVEAALEPVIALVTDRLIARMTSAFQAIRGALRQLEAAWAAHGQRVTASVTQFMTAVEGALGQGLSALNALIAGNANAFAQKFTMMVGQAKQAVATGLTAIKPVVKQGLIGLQTTVAAQAKRLPQPLRDAMATMKDVLALGLSALNAAVEGNIGAFARMFSLMFDRARQAVSQGLAALKQPLQQGLSAFVQVPGTLRQRLPKPFRDALGTVEGIVRDALGQMAQLWQQHRQAVLGAIRPLLQPIQTLGQKLGYLDAQGRPTIQTLGKVGVAIAGLTTPTTTAAGAITALNTVWTNNILNIRTVTERELTRVRQVWTTQIQPLVADARRIFTQVLTVIRNVLAELRTSVVQPILGSILQLWQTHGAAILREVVETYNVLTDRLRTTMNVIKTIIGPALTVIAGLWRAWGDEVVTIVRFAFDTIGSFLNTTLDAIATAIRVTLNVIQGDWQEAWTAVAEFYKRTFDGILNFAQKWGSGFLDWLRNEFIQNFIEFFEFLRQTLIGGSIIPEMFSAIRSFTESWVSSFLSFFQSSFIDAVISAATNLASQLIGGGSGGIIGTMFSDIRSALSSFVSGFLDDWSTFGSNVVSEAESFLGDVVSAFESALSTVKSIASSIIGAAESAAGQASDALSSAKSAADSAAQAAARADRNRRDAANGDGVDGPSGATKGFAHGGIVTEPTTAVIGEAGDDEAVIPLNAEGEDVLAGALSGALEQVTADTGGGGATPQIVVKNNEFHGVEDADDTAEAIYDELNAHL